MAIVYVDNTNSESLQQKIQLLSTDTKPLLTAENNGSKAIVVDTGDVFIWHIDQWYAL